MLTSSFVSASLIAATGAYSHSRPRRSPRSPSDRSVLARPPHMPQQLSLFGPPGGRR